MIMTYKIEDELVEKMIVERNGRICIIHCHNADAGKVIKCFPNTAQGKKDALKMHYAIMANKYKESSSDELLFLIKYSMINGFDNEAIRYLEELGRRKEIGETDVDIHFKSTNNMMYKHWERIKGKLDKQTLAILTLNPQEYAQIRDTLIKLKELKAGYFSTAKPAYRMELPTLWEDIKALGWDKEQLEIDLKADGSRSSLSKIKNVVRIFVDPEDLKLKSPDISDRLPLIAKEFDSMVPNNTIVDCELYAANKNEALHRTSTNAIVNTKEDAEKFKDYIFEFVFDVLFYNGKDLRNLPLEERLKYLSKIKSSEHIKIEDVTSTLEPNHQGYILERPTRDKLDRVVNIILSGKHGLHKNLEEGVMIKLSSGIYQTPQNKNWGKAKRLLEVDSIAYDRTLVKGQTKVFNYDLGINVNKEYYDKLPAKAKIEFDGKHFLTFGRSDNSKLDIHPSSTTVIRSATEEVNKFENEDYPEAPWYRGYINVLLSEIPEKVVSDSLSVLDKLSKFQPRRLSIEELARFNQTKISEKIVPIVQSLSEYSDLKLILLSYKLNAIDREKWHVPYKPEKLTNEQLADDWRLLVAVSSKLENNQKVEVQENSGQYFNKELLVEFAVKLAKEIAKRKSDEEINFKIREDKSEVYDHFWSIVKDKLTDDEIKILLE